MYKDLLPGRLTPISRSFPLVFLLMAILLLPVYAPWLNPGYAAAQPNHQHIYFGDVRLDHHKHSSVPHDHPDPRPTEQNLAPGVDYGVILLPDQAAAGQILPLLPDAGDLTFWMEQTGRGTLSFILGAAYVGVMLVFLSRPVPPPRSYSPSPDTQFS